MKTNRQGYVSVTLTQASKDLLDEKLGHIEGMLSFDKSHMTLMYDVRNPDLNTRVSKQIHEMRVTGVEMMGALDSPWRAIVLKLQTEGSTALERFNELRAKGYQHSYPNFQAHVSLKYRPSPEDIEEITEAAQVMVGKTLAFGNEQFKKIRN